MSIKLKHILTLGLLSLTLQGCVVNLGNDEHGPGWSSSSSHEAQWQETRNKIADLNVGSSYSDVKNKLGDSSFSEAFTLNNMQYKVLFYRTHFVKGDGHDTKDECTPVIFADGKLLGWGDEILSQVTEEKQS
ncbi:DUF3192 domain-containing protein [Veronia pacifica]|uniref:DUF3192 domain-containing protein n=1 Tax=Veronia pacifica TaxID=1080227 RepID=A0A1C3EKX2_9GAMM|nr:DUF3192 domain-containing protein [Veronia pacifica]ODA33879.1 hypothetical protein A8L45_08630 [Veronia pacifica]